MLESYGVSNKDIFIGVQTESDLESYSNKYESRCTIVFSKEAVNAAGNRNGLLDNFKGESRCLMLDDDLRRISRIEPSISRNGNETVKFVPLKPSEFISLVKEMAEYDADIAGANHIDKRYLLRDSLLKPQVINNKLIEGSFMMINNPYFRFCEDVTFAEDFELCFKTLAGGGSTARNIRHVIVKASSNGKAGGGCHHLYSLGKKFLHDAMKREIVNKYKGIAAFTTKKPDCISLKVVNI